MPPYETEVSEFWTVDSYLDPQPESMGKPFLNRSEAERKAREWSDAYTNTPIAVWDQDCKVWCIWINGNLFWPA